jgi:hypothetical protein
MENFKEYKKEDILKIISEDVQQQSFDDFDTQVQSDELSPIFDEDGEFTLGEDPQGNKFIIRNAFSENPTILPIS